ncbi:GTP-binding protein [Desulfurobacterium thermolithotrophum]|uniref:GTP-binding protein n=1 Tax=Desulfurobacterium thermolithotrophum TaxID=64160 RepID=UPI0013D83599|nr:hypothetical protein [Desulfurobacterium thermolithotrophum]
MKKKVIVCGPYNAGKTTFIKNINPQEFIGTEKREFDLENLIEKETTTTVGIEMNFLKNGTYQFLFFGLPGQEKFDFIWEIIGENFDGILFLHPAYEDVRKLKFYIDFFSKTNSFSKAFKMILITHCDEAKINNFETFKQFGFPIKTIDPRKKEEVFEIINFITKIFNGDLYVKNL